MKKKKFFMIPFSFSFPKIMCIYLIVLHLQIRAFPYWVGGPNAASTIQIMDIDSTGKIAIAGTTGDSQLVSSAAVTPFI
jgi:hypothetical protein